MIEKKHIQETDVIKELQEIAPVLASIEKSNPFSIDNDYFTDLSNSVQNKISEESKAKVLKQKVWILKPQYSISIAAAIIILIAFAITFLNDDTEEKRNNIQQNLIANDNSTSIENQEQDSKIEEETRKAEKSRINQLNSKDNILIANDKLEVNPIEKSPSTLNKEKSKLKNNLPTNNNSNNKASYANSDNGKIHNPGSSTSNPINNN